ALSPGGGSPQQDREDGGKAGKPESVRVHPGSTECTGHDRHDPSPPLRQRALAEDDESLAIAGDGGRHLSGGLVDEHAPGALAVGAAQDHLSVRVIDVSDRRLRALLSRVRMEVLELLALRIDLEDGGEVDVDRRAAPAPAVRAA